MKERRDVDKTETNEGNIKAGVPSSPLINNSGNIKVGVPH